MTFVERFFSRDRKLKAYIDDSGIEVFGDSFNEARNHLIEVIDANFKSKDYGHLIAVAYGFEGQKIVEIFQYDPVKENNWPGNPAWELSVYENSKLLPEERKSCENMGIIIGAEGQLRRQTKNLAEYLEKPIKLDFLPEEHKELFYH